MLLEVVLYHIVNNPLMKVLYTILIFGVSVIFAYYVGLSKYERMTLTKFVRKRLGILPRMKG